VKLQQTLPADMTRLSRPGMAEGTLGLSLSSGLPMSFKTYLLFVSLFLCGAGLRAMNVTRPIDQPEWRECDEASIARNFYDEGMNILYPRVDWRGSGPGYAEMEFPLQPWLMALLYQVFGYKEVFGRVIVLVTSLLTMFIFFRLALYLLPSGGALAAVTFFAFHPMLIRMATAVQPEGIMILFYVLAVFAFVRWLQQELWRDYWVALVATALAILAKAPAANLGLFFAILMYHRSGFSGFLDPKAWLFGLGALLPGVLWYTHARSLWLTYGNSLGLSNEYHWVGLDLFTNPQFLRGILRQEIAHVWTLPGAIVGFACIIAAWRERLLRVELAWLAAIGVFYLVSARTTRKEWSYYYHIFSVIPAALLLGTGVASLRKWQWQPRHLTALFLLIVCGTTLFGVMGYLGTSLPSERVVHWAAGLGVPALLLGGLGLLGKLGSHDGPPPRHSLGNSLFACILMCGLGASYFSEIVAIHWHASPWGRDPLYQAAAHFQGRLSEPGLIVASGASCQDRDGYALAYNNSYMFYWLHRKGFNMPLQRQSLSTLRELSNQGARYFVAEKLYVVSLPGFYDELRSNLTLIAETDVACLYRLPTGQ